MRVHAVHDLAVELQHEAQHAMGRRVLRPEVDVEVADLLLARVGVDDLCAVHVALPQPGARRRHVAGTAVAKRCSTYR